MGTTTRTKRDVGYARLSHADPDEQGAIARQKQDIRRVSERTGGHLVGPILVDNAISASRYARRARKDYPKIAQLARAGAVDRAVIYDVDRLLRIPRELEDLIDLVEELGGAFEVVGVHGVMDLTTGDGRYYARMRVAQAAKESDDTSRRLRRTFDQYAEQGVPIPRMTGKSRPLGWRDGGMEHDPGEAELIRQAAADVLAGDGFNTVARRWNETGVRSRGGALWTNRTVRSVLISPRNAGRRIHRGEDIGPAAWPAIIDAETHARLLRLVDQRTREPARRGPFTGLFWSTDGRPMTRDSINNAQRVYRTRRGAPGAGQGPPSVTIGPADDLEALILEILFQDVETGGVGRRLAERRRQRPEAAHEDPAAIEREMVELAEDKAEGRVTRAEWLAMRRPLERRLAAAQAAVNQVEDTTALEGIDPDIRERWHLPVDQGGYSDDRKRRILLTMYERVEIAPARRRGPGFDPDRVTPIGRA